MNHHYLKIWPVHYRNVKAGTKTFEIRNNDRAFQKGDLVTLEKWDPINREYFDDESLHFTVGDVYPIDSERVVFSLLPKKASKQ